MSTVQPGRGKGDHDICKGRRGNHSVYRRCVTGVERCDIKEEDYYARSERKRKKHGKYSTGSEFENPSQQKTEQPI